MRFFFRPKSSYSSLSLFHSSDFLLAGSLLDGVHVGIGIIQKKGVGGEYTDSLNYITQNQTLPFSKKSLQDIYVTAGQILGGAQKKKYTILNHQASMKKKTPPSKNSSTTAVKHSCYSYRSRGSLIFLIVALFPSTTSTDLTLFGS